ncbi:glycoside hydrolase family 31 protein [Pedococcus aerophilus]|uniref:Glycoside hydrolase family 31 protein n=1 Tax=Pedococcus aerophilus TaxID=436356 RepID=A0ABP6H8R0_9MICO
MSPTHSRRRLRWSLPIAAILAMVGALVIPQQAAFAGTLSGVFHSPYGADELYGAQPTERAPRDPMAGESVVVKATTWPVSPGQTVWVTWKKNGVDQTPIGAAFDYNNGNNSYWKIALGSFARGDQIQYWVNADVDGAGARQVGPYSFTATSWSGTGNVTGYVNNSSSVDVTTTDTGGGSFTPKVRFTFPAADRFHVQIAPKGTGLNITGTTGYTVTDSAGTLTLATSKMQVKIQKTPYRVSVYKADGTTLISRQYDPATFRNLGWASDGSTTVSKIEDHWLTPAGERIEGLGERYDQTNQRGNDVHNYVYNQYQDQGPTKRTYLSVPFFTNSAGYGIYVPSTRYSQFNLGTTRSDMAGFTVDTGGAAASTMDYYFFTGTPAEILDAYTATTARPKLPPKWAFGLWMSANEWNTQAEVNAELANVTSSGIPHSAMVLEQWSDEATFYLWHGATYTPKPGSGALTYADLTFPPGSAWSDPKAMVTAAHNQGIKMVLWQIPVLKENFDTNPATAPQQHLNDRSYAAAQGYLVGDGSGAPYRIPTGQWFGDSTVPDFTNTAATNWWMSKRSYLFDDIGIDGLKTDGSEALFGRNLTVSDGRKGDEMHNAYPNEYTRAYSNFVQTKTGGTGALFSRAGTSGAQANSIFWAGDQASTFSAFQQAVKAGISSGQSGIPFWAWDMAGFTGTFPSSELYLRSAAQATFSPIMQYHSEKSNPSTSEARTPWNVQARTGDTSVLPTFKKFANVRMNLVPYLYTEAKQAADTGLPMMQAMGIQYPADATAGAQDQQYMFGRQLLVAPITTQGATSKSVYLPAGEWYDFWNGGRAIGAGTKTYNAGTDSIPVFAKAGAIIPLNLNANYELGGTIGNSVSSYSNLVFRVYPSGTSSYDYSDDAAGLKRTITSTENWAAHQATVSVPALTTKSTLQVSSTAPTGVTAAGTALTAYSSISALAAATTGYYWDPVQQLTHVKLASSASARSVVLSGVDKAGYEAEFGTATGTTTNTDHTGYTGTGFVDGFETVGDSVTSDVSVAVAGTHALKFRYSNGSGTSATRTVQVDGVTVGTLTLPPTANWDTWGTATLSTSLTAGKRTVKLSYASGNATGINYDNLVVARP